jgi:D-alanyl-D-alanine dipeptidase
MSIWYEHVYDRVTQTQRLTRRAAPIGVNTLLIVLASVITFVIPADAQQQARTWDQKLEADGFVNVQRINPEIRVQLIYATKHNFTGKPLYKGLTKAWLHPDAANKLNKAQKLL